MKTRFCPSPTGELHLGSARTALYNFLLAKKSGGSFLFRIEDTDRERSKIDFIKSIIYYLNWLDIKWDEGLDFDLKNSNFMQSNRTYLYEEYQNILFERGHSYPCFCSIEELEKSRKKQMLNKKPSMYSGKCRSISKNDALEKIKNGEKYVVRFKVNKDIDIQFNDFIRGSFLFKAKTIDDFIIKRSDGKSSFLFCNIIDDYLMGITHIVRGEDHIANTPKQIMIIKALGFKIPNYGHIPLIVNDENKPLSKRDNSFSLKKLNELGYFSEVVVNYLFRLGHAYSKNDLLTGQELINNFDINSLGKSAAKFDIKQLNNWQKKYLASLTILDFKKWAFNRIEPFKDPVKENKFFQLVKDNIISYEDLIYWYNVLITNNLLEANAKKNSLYFSSIGPEFFSKFKWFIETYNIFEYNALINFLKNELQINNKKIFKTIRIALTGIESGPELKGIMEILDKKIIILILNQILEILYRNKNEK